MNLNSYPSSFPNDHDDQHPFATNHQVIIPSSISSVSYGHVFFNTTQASAHTGYNYHRQLYHQPHDHQANDKYGTYDGAGSSFEIKNNTVDDQSLKLTLGKKDEDQRNISEKGIMLAASKMRLTPRMNNINPDHNTDLKNCSYNSNSPIRVCSDCNTTKTPLWRSGPKGPKSLCNACGIRQRKARRAAMAAAATYGTMAVANNNSDQPPTPMKIKLIKHSNKEIIKMDENRHSNLPLKKRCKMAAAGTSGQMIKKKKKKLSSFEEMLINLSNNISFRRVFPEDEKDAAILLMALSSGLLHS